MQQTIFARSGDSPDSDDSTDFARSVAADYADPPITISEAGEEFPEAERRRKVETTWSEVEEAELRRNPPAAPVPPKPSLSKRAGFKSDNLVYNIAVTLVIGSMLIFVGYMCVTEGFMGGDDGYKEE